MPINAKRQIKGVYIHFRHLIEVFYQEIIFLHGHVNQQYKFINSRVGAVAFLQRSYFYFCSPCPCTNVTHLYNVYFSLYSRKKQEIPISCLISTDEEKEMQCYSSMFQARSSFCIFALVLPKSIVFPMTPIFDIILPTIFSRT